MLKCKIFCHTKEIVEEEFNKFCAEQSLTSKNIIHIAHSIEVIGYETYYSIMLMYEENVFAPFFPPESTSKFDETIFYAPYPTSSQ
jgi:hypothetical protein